MTATRMKHRPSGEKAESGSGTRDYGFIFSDDPHRWQSSKTKESQKKYSEKSNETAKEKRKLNKAMKKYKKIYG